MSDAAAQTTNMAASVSAPQPFGPALGRFQAQAGAILAQPAIRRSLPMVLGTLAIALVAIIYIMTRDRKSVVYGKSVSVRVDFGGCRIINKKTTKPNNTRPNHQ